MSIERSLQKQSIRTMKEENKLTLAGAGGRITARGASTFLEMKGSSPTPRAERVALVPPLTETPRSFTLITDSSSNKDDEDFDETKGYSPFPTDNRRRRLNRS